MGEGLLNEELYKRLLEKIYGHEILDVELLKEMIMKKAGDMVSDLELYKSITGDTTADEIINTLKKNYKKYSSLIIDYFSMKKFKMPIEMAILTKKQEEIKEAFLTAAGKMGFGKDLQLQIDSDIDEIAQRLNIRFSFDEASLIHLIEASKGTNIQLEEDTIRTKGTKRQILKQDGDGKYYLADITSSGVNTYTNGRPIPIVEVEGYEKSLFKPTIDSARNIDITAYPGGKELVGKSTDEIMKTIMKNLFDNLELCIELYKTMYTEDRRKSLQEGTALENTAKAADGSLLDFYYYINSWNLPHLLGIQNGKILPDSVINYFATTKPDGSLYYPIDKDSSASKILKVLLENKDRIIADGGLIEENGNIYQLFPWEKIILKTSSVIRGDFFRTCFCLVELRRGMNSPDEKYVTISPTKYDGSIFKGNYKSVLRDLLSTQRQRKDFIFRTFVENFDCNGNRNGYVPNSIDTGKAETIVTKSADKIKTLDRARNVLRSDDPNGGGKIVEGLEQTRSNNSGGYNSIKHNSVVTRAVGKTSTNMENVMIDHDDDSDIDYAINYAKDFSSQEQIPSDIDYNIPAYSKIYDETNESVNLDKQRVVGKAATSIENEIMGKKEFSPLEQIQLKYDIESDLPVHAKISDKAKEYLRNLLEELRLNLSSNKSGLNERIVFDDNIIEKDINTLNLSEVNDMSKFKKNIEVSEMNDFEIELREKLEEMVEQDLKKHLSLNNTRKK